MENQEIRTALDRHWAASAAGDIEAEHEIYHDDVLVEYPQSGERSAVVTTFRPCADTTRRSWASSSGASLAAAISGSPSTCSAITGSQRKQSALWSFAMARLPTRHSTLPIRSSHLPGELSGLSIRRNSSVKQYRQRKNGKTWLIFDYTSVELAKIPLEDLRYERAGAT